MLQKRCIGLVLMMFAAIFSASAQKAERDYIRKGNRAFKDSVFVDAEVNYRKALEVNPKSSISMYNLGNTLVRQNKVQEAMEQYSAAAKIEKDKSKLAYIFHNIGDIFQTQKDYAKAVEAYKESLRNNPKDDETRYNQDQNQDQNKEQEKKEQEKKDQENKQDQQNNQQQQPPQSQKQNEQMSKENAEQLLKSVMQDEKDVQDKVKKQQQVIQGGRLEKDW